MGFVFKILLMFSFVSCPLISGTLAAQSLSHYTEGQDISGFKVSAQYTDHQDETIGLRLVHSGSGLVIFLLQMDTVPQAAIAIRTYAQSDNGAAHALEHLIVSKGIQGRTLKLLSDMKLSDTAASTGAELTWYHLYSGSGMESFYEVFEQHLKALFRPDFSDEEAENEIYHFGVSKDRQTGLLALTEKGTVYSEIQSNQGYRTYMLNGVRELEKR